MSISMTNEYLEKFGVSGWSQAYADILCKVCGHRFGNHRGVMCPLGVEPIKDKPSPLSWPEDK
jgi:virulence-associated protein VapD